jgi:dual specificity tyrosine-phosphorylation-regulated kinase 2/3/4
MDYSRPPFVSFIPKPGVHPTDVVSSQDAATPARRRPLVPELHLTAEISKSSQNEPLKATPREKPATARQGGPANSRPFHVGRSIPRPQALPSPVVPDAPISPSIARIRYCLLLNQYEMSEIKDYPEIYYVGHPAKKVRANSSGALNFGFDDVNHHYRCLRGDHIAYRFEIRGLIGRGAFGQVLLCLDHKTKADVALKIIVNTAAMRTQGRTECSLVQMLNGASGFTDAHIVRAMDSFTFRRHICAAFEVLGRNLYDVCPSAKGRRLGGAQLRAIARCVLTSLAFMHSNSVLHADMKPENVLLVPDSADDVRVIDFGSSCLVGHEHFEYIQSRFYRAPEVILGMSYGPPIDIWSFGCMLAEMAVGRPLFPGADEPEQMPLLIEVLGLPPREIVNGCKRKKVFFQSDGKPLRPNTCERRKPGGKSLKDATRLTDDLLLDLIAKCLEWDQTNRITAADALGHPWLAEGEPAGAEPSPTE